MNDFSIVGKSLPRIDGPLIVTGDACYTVDVSLPEMLLGRVVRSTVPHARIRRLSVDKAKNVKGVKAILTAADVPQIRFGLAIKDEFIFVRDKVRYVGDAIAAIAATDEEALEEAARLIEIDYEELPAVFDVEEAAKEGAPLVHEDLKSYALTTMLARGWNPKAGTNIAHEAVYSKGNMERGWSESDQIFEDTFTVSQVQHCSLEPHAVIASYEGGRLTVWSSTQKVFLVRHDLAELFGFPESKIRVIGTKMGGGFGGKNSLRVEPYAVALSLQLGKPVKVVLPRTEEFSATGGSVPARIRMKTGVKNDGTLVAREVRILWDTGAYAHGLPGCNRALKDGAGGYRIPHVRIVSTLVYTNKLRGCQFRGLGVPEAAWASESQIDMIAERLRIDPLELRLKNCVRSGDETPSGDVLDNHGLVECIEKVCKEIDYRQKKSLKGTGRGVGFVILHKSPPSSGASSNACVSINEDGSIQVLTGATEVGGGTETSLGQIAAEEIGVPLEDVSVITADTAMTPFDHGTFSSRVVLHVGTAVRLAALNAKRQLLALASRTMEVPPDHLETRNKRIIHKKSGRSIGFEEILAGPLVPEKTIMGKASFTPGRPSEETSQPLPSANTGWKFGAQAVELEVDRDTGKVRLLKFVSANDVGKAINPSLVEGQIEGGVVQGIGYALYEQLLFEEGRITNCSFSDYLIPTSYEVPPIIPIIVETPEIAGPFGARGVGEVSLAGVAPAIANAIHHAIGVRITELPITPEKILAALNGSG